MRSVGRFVLTGVFSCALLLGISPPADAREPQMCPICSKLKNQSASYGEKAGNTLSRGVLNFTLGWTELIRQPAKKARAGGNVWHGIANGIGKSTTRTARGLGEVLTFWMPKMRGNYIHFSKDCPIDTMQ